MVRSSENFEACFARDIRLGLAALLVRQIEVLHAGFRVGGEDLMFELIGELALLLDAGQHGLFPLSEFNEVGITLLNVAQLRIIEPTRDFLAVTSNEGHSVALCQKGERSLYLGGADVNFFRDNLCDSHSGKSSRRTP